MLIYWNFQISRSNRRSIHRTAMAIHIKTLRLAFQHDY